MNKLYLIVPAVLTIAFGGIYYQHSVESAKNAEAKLMAAEQAAQKIADEKAAAERQAREDADRRAAERAAEEKRKDEERAARWAAAGETIANDSATYRSQADALAAELKQLEARLAALRAEKDKATQAQLDLDLAVERARIAKRTAEFEIQRFVEMVATRAGTSFTGTVSPQTAPAK